MAVNENSSFAVDWKLALVAIVALVAGGVTILEGGPLVTKSELAAHDAVEQDKFDKLTDAQTTQANAGLANANAISTTNSQVADLRMAIQRLTDHQEIEDSEITELKQQHQIDSLKKDLREKKYANKLDQQSYERQFKAMEGQARKRAAAGS